MEKHILLTSDLSEPSSRAFAPVRDLAALIGARVTLLHVIQTLTEHHQGASVATPGLPVDLEHEETSAHHALEKQGEQLGKDLEVEVAVTTSPDIAKGIVKYAEEHGAGLIALSTHGRSGVRRMLLGSVAEAVLRHAHVPVLCFPPPPEED